MLNLRLAAAVLAVCLASTVTAHEPNRYRVNEVASPAFSGDAACLPGYARKIQIVGINDAGTVAANYRCLTAVNPDFLQFNYRAFISSPAFGGYELAQSPSMSGNYVVNIDRRGTAYGEDLGVGNGAIWRTGAGLEAAFTPTCDGTSTFSIANSGNPHGYAVGITLVRDPSLPPPLDQFCFTIGWAIRTPAGLTVTGPVQGQGNDVNVHDVAVGDEGHAAIRLDLVSGAKTVLNPGDATHAAKATDINDAGVVAGWIDEVPAGSAATCGPSAPRVWEKNGRERALKLLPGAVSGRAWGAGYDDEVVGEVGTGDYCDAAGLYDQFAVIWIERKPYDLNSLIPRNANLTLVYASDVNRNGQIAVAGYRNDDPLLPCPEYDTNPETGGVIIDATLLCRQLRAYVLTPRR